MFSTISQDYKNRQVIFIVTSLFLLIGIVRLGQVGSPGVLVRLPPAEVLPDMVVGLTELIDQIIDVLQGHFLRFKDPPARLSATLPVLNAFNRLRPNTQCPPNQTAASQASLLQKCFPAPPLSSEI